MRLNLARRPIHGIQNQCDINRNSFKMPVLQRRRAET
jgi:hypothetical protein